MTQELLEGQAADEFRANGTKVLTVPTDVTDEEQIKALFEKSMDAYGRLDILVNNAGAFNGGPIGELATEDWDWVINVNLRAPFICTREAFAIMKAQGEGPLGFFFVSSTSGVSLPIESVPVRHLTVPANSASGA